MPPRIDGTVAMHAVTKQFSALALTLAALSTAACGGDDMTLPGNNTGGMGSGGMGSGGEPPVIAPTDCASSPPPRAPLRRLTRYEYNNTARDLLGDTTSPANAFPSELLGNGFGNDADSQPVGSELANQYMLVSETVAAVT
jgi:hypothetical protein